MAALFRVDREAHASEFEFSGRTFDFEDGKPGIYIVELFVWVSVVAVEMETEIGFLNTRPPMFD